MNISWIKRGMKLFAFIAFVFPLTVSAASYVYTSTADFEGGNLDGLVTDPADQLQLGTTGSTFPVMWIANAGEDTVSKIDTDNNVETARYRTWIAPAALHGAWTGPAPSRTGVDVDGNVYIANRHFDGRAISVVKILAEGGIDRNGSGTIETSRDLDNNGTISGAELLPITDDGDGIFECNATSCESADERIAWVVQIPGTDGDLGRSLCVGTDSNVWVGAYNTGIYYKLSSADGSGMGSMNTGGRPYGCAIDSNGILYGANLSNYIVRGDTNTFTGLGSLSHSGQGSSYAITVGNGNKVYLGSTSGHSFIEYDPGTNTFSTPSISTIRSLGVAVDGGGRIVVSGYSGIRVYNANKTLHCSSTVIPGGFPSDIRGSVVDANGDYWSVSRSSSEIIKYDQDCGFIMRRPVGYEPYTYSDVTGFAARNTTTPTGVWNVIVDGGSADFNWENASWTSNIPTDAQIVVRVRTANDPGDLEFVSYSAPISNGGGFVAVGQYAEFKVSLTANPDGDSPILNDFSAEGSPANEPPDAKCKDQAVSTPADACVADANIDDGSSDPDGDTLVLSQSPTGPYGLGNTVVQLTATEVGTNPVLFDTCLATVTVTDDTDPAVDAGANQLHEATSTGGAPAVLSIFSSDACGPPSIDVAPALAIYPLGTTTVTVTATDGSNNDASDTVDIKVVDTTPPVLTIPDDIEVEATGPQTPVSIGSASATDIFPLTISNNAPADYPVGSTPVVWTALDANNNSTSLTQTITVVDTTAPVVTPPADLVVVSTGLLTPADLGIATATDAVGVVSGPTPDLPGPFLAGTTTIVWSASDAAGNVGTAIQTITVLGQLVCEMEVDGGDKSKKSGKSGKSGKSDKSGKSGKSGKSDKSGKSGKSGKSEKTPGIRMADSMHLETYNSDENIETLWDSLFAATPGVNETLTMQSDNVLTWQAGEIELSGQIGLSVSSGKKSDKSGKRSGKRSGKGKPPAPTGPVLKKITLTDAKKKQGTTDFVSSSGGVDVNLADGGWHDVMVKGMDGVEVIIDGESVTGHLKQLKLQLAKSSTVATPVVKDFRLVLSAITEMANVKKGLAGSVVVRVPATVVTALGSTVYDEESKDGPAVLGGHTEAEFDSEGGLIGVDISSLLDGSNDNLHQRKGACVVNIPNQYEGGEGEEELPDDGEGEGDGPLPDDG